MKIVIQRVSSAEVKVKGEVVGRIEQGLFVLLGIKKGDTKKNADNLVEKLVKLRLMSDEKQKMNLSVKDKNSSVLLVSQFTLYANTKDGNRPSFLEAEESKKAEELYEYFIDLLRKNEVEVSTGAFGNYMDIEAKLDGPVTLVLEN